jgi:site-specific DNA-cytosine methylase
VVNGIPNRSHRIRCLGNAVVPEIPQLIVSQLIKLEGDV